MTAELARPSVNKPRVHAAVVRRLGHSILSGDLKPGEALPNEARLCADLAISRTARREAIRVLTHLLDDADYLVARDQGQPGIRQLPVNDVQVGPAHGATAHAQKELTRAGLGRGDLHAPQGLAGTLQYHRSHGFLLPTARPVVIGKKP